MTTKFKELAERIKRHQEALKLSDEAFVLRYPRLGSAKSLRARIYDGKTDAKDPGKWEAVWMARLQHVSAEIDGVTMPEEFFQDLPFVKAMDGRLAILESQTTDRRCLVALAPTGCGKSVWASRKCADKAGARVYIRANESWRDSKNTIASRIAGALAVEAGKSSADATDAVTQKLLSTPMTVFIDSAHEAGIMLMKLCREWIDGTRSRIVYMGYPTEYDRMVRSKTGSWDEAKQFLGRSLKPIYDDYRQGLRAGDVKVFLSHAGISGEHAASLAQDILPSVRANGNMRLLADAFADAQAEADDDGIDVTPDHIRRAVADLCPAGKEAA